IRELPVYLSCNPALFDPSVQNIQTDDQVMLRGRLDAAIDMDDGLVLIDYKTDRISSEQVPERSVAYERQIRFYCDALARIGKKKIAAAYLAFLTPRVLRPIKTITTASAP
ncbi:MAG TPA: PD-(D/E)XK nuclease family protein, partial [Tepidisphaeraceae bacterium]|nr:PD-(D/E)XK nuclease family protein [Tepidisphaeraceae bacterium]